jgi:hypothetical protein
MQKLLRIDLPIIQASSNGKAGYRQSLSGGVPQRLSYPSPKLKTALNLQTIKTKNEKDRLSNESFS